MRQYSETAADFVRFSGAISTVHNRSLPGQHQVGLLPLSCRQVCRNAEGRGRELCCGFRPISPDSWGQLGRLRANEGVISTKQRVAPYLVVKFAGIPRVNGLGRYGADALLKTFDSVLPCKRNFNTPFNSNFYDKHLYERARMKSAHGTAENIGCSITTNKDALQSAVARRLTGRAGGLSAIADFQTHAPKLPRQAGTALFECRR